MEQGFGLYQQLSTPPIFWPSLLTIRAATHASAGDTDRALALVDDAWASLTEGHPAAAEVALAQGDILLAGPTTDHAAARTLFDRAAELSAERGARMLQLQALTRLATPGAGVVKDEDLRRLRELYDGFTEGHATPPLRAAAAALAASA
jgi:hypothetical protein